MWVPILIIYTAAILQSDGRKYDIEEECKKLYGESMSKVLKRFRRTPEYLTILQKRMIDMNNQIYTNIILQLYLHESIALQKSIMEMFNVSDNKEEDGDGTRVLRELYHQAPIIGAYPNSRRYWHKKFKRQDEEKPPGDNKPEEKEEETETLSPIEKLDNVYTNSLLTVAERNMFRDMGFETAGKIFHKLIAILDDDSSGRSTKFPSDTKYTLKHSTVTEHVHEVTQSTLQHESTVVGNEVEGDAMYYRHRNKKIRMF